MKNSPMAAKNLKAKKLTSKQRKIDFYTLASHHFYDSPTHISLENHIKTRTHAIHLGGCCVIE